MTWYAPINIKTALRKHMLRVDLRIYPGDTSSLNQNDLMSTLKSLLTSAIIRGLDVVGIVAPSSSQAGWLAHQVAQENHMDIWVLPGEDYMCADKFHIMVYQMKEPMKPGLTMDKAISYAHSKHAWVMAIDVTKRQAQHLNKLKGTDSAPDAVEIYNAVSGGYSDVFVDFPRFISSCAKNAREIEISNAHTLIHRNDLEATGLLPEGEGKEYVPGYLQRDQEQQMQKDNSATLPGQQVNNGT